MKKVTIPQEILIATSTRFFLKQLSEKIGVSSRNPDIRKIEEGCCNGLLDELFPEVFRGSTSGLSIFLLNLRYDNSVVQIAFTDPRKGEKVLSIDPFFFLPLLGCN